MASVQILNSAVVGKVAERPQPAPPAGVRARPAPPPDSGPAPAPAVHAPPAPPSHANLEAGRQALEDAVKRIREYIKDSPTSLEYTEDRESGRILLRITDADSGQLLLQVPSEEVLAVARAIDRFEGLFVQQKA